MDGLTQVIQGTSFSTLDWVIVAGYMLISVAIGLIARRYVANMGDFIVAGRGLRTALGIATITGTELGLVTVMYSAQKGFTGGFAAFHMALAAGIGTLFVGMTGFVVSSLRRHGVMTIAEFYGKRFGPRTRILGGLILAFAGILNMGMFLKAGSIFVVGITGMSAEGSALTLVMMGLLALVLFYTMLGGMISVILADYVQFVVLSFGLLVATAIAIVKLGWGTIFSTVVENMGEAGFNPLVAESSFGPSYVVWMFFAGILSCAFWPTMVARALAAESPEVVKRQYRFAAVSFAIRFIVPYFWGICAFVLVMKAPDLKAVFFPNGGTESPHSLYALPILFGRILPVGLIGLISAAMIAAFMSTHDSYLLCWSSVLTHDVAAPILGKRLTQRGRILLTRLLILLIGIAVFLVSMVFPLREDLWDYMMVTGTIYFAGAFALLTAGLYWKKASSTGAILALLTGCFALLGVKGFQEGIFVNLLGMAPERLEPFTGVRINLVTCGLAVAAMVIGSLAFPDKHVVLEEK